MTESDPRSHRHLPQWVPHTPAYLDDIKDPEERRVAGKIAWVWGKLQLIEEEYSHLFHLPPQLPPPLYDMQDPPGYCKDDASRAFYRSCAEGDLDRVRMFVAGFAPTAADLSFALEEACQNLRPAVVRFLMWQPEAQLHYRCFRRCTYYHQDDLIEKYDGRTSYSLSESIFTSGSRELLPLLRVLVDSGWHPNQLLDILRFLLDAGADPTIGREVNSDIGFVLIDLPVQRLQGHILEMAVNLGAAEAVDLLVSDGARPEHGVTLPSLVRQKPDPADAKVMDEEYREELCKETPWLEYPTLSNRLAMAQQLMDLGGDINRVDNVFRLVGRYARMPTIMYEATPLLHARDSMDWEFLRLLLENGADPAIRPRHAMRCSERIYSIGKPEEILGIVEEIQVTFQDMTRQFRQPVQTAKARADSS